MNPSRSIEARVQQLSPAQRNWLAKHLNELNDSHQASSNDHSDLVAWVVAKSDEFDATALRRVLHEQLPSRLVPRRILRTATLPRTVSGKIDRKRLVAETIPDAAIHNQTLDLISESERILIRICRSLLGIRDLTPQDNFFHVGGDSLSSIRLIAMAREQGLEIEPQDVLQCPSIAALAAAADRRGARETLQPSAAATNDVVTKIRTGAGTGSLLLVHEVGGQCHYAHYLAAELAADRALYVSQQPSLDHAPTSLESLADLYCESWLRKQPTGPRVLVAFCWGGLLAFEIARQMKRRGTAIDKLLIVESGTEAAYVHAPRMNRIIDRGKGILVRARNRLHTLQDRGGVVRLMQTMIRKVTQQNRLPLTADAGFQFRDDEGDPLQIRQNVQAFLDYAISKEPLPMHLFRVAGPTGLIGTRYCDRTLGWRYVVGEHLIVHSIGGTHATCMQPPYVSQLAAQMNEVIQRD